MEYKNCEICNNRFKYYVKNQKYCHACYIKKYGTKRRGYHAKLKNYHLNKKKKGNKITCKICGSPAYDGANHKSKICGKCRLKVRGERIKNFKKRGKEIKEWKEKKLQDKLNDVYMKLKENFRDMSFNSRNVYHLGIETRGNILGLLLERGMIVEVNGEGKKRYKVV